MSEEKKKLEKNDLQQIISNIIEVTILSMYNADGLAEQNLCEVTYALGVLIYRIDSYNYYSYEGTLSRTKDHKCFSFAAEIKHRDESVGRIHIGSVDGSKEIYNVEVVIDGSLHIYDFKLANGQIELINNYEESKKYEDDSVTLENDKDSQAFVK